MNKYKVGDKFIIEIGEVYNNKSSNTIYKIHGLKSLYDEETLNKLEVVEDQKIRQGDICKYGWYIEACDVLVTSDTIGTVSGVYLNGENKGKVGCFRTNELRKTGKYFNFDSILYK